MDAIFAEPIGVPLDDPIGVVKATLSGDEEEENTHAAILAEWDEEEEEDDGDLGADVLAALYGGDPYGLDEL